MILSKQRPGVLTRRLEQMPKPMLYLCCEGKEKGGGGFDKRVEDVSDHWRHMEAGRERIKEHLRLALGKAASTSEDTGQHRGRTRKVPGTHSLTAEGDWQPVQLASCTATSVH